MTAQILAIATLVATISLAAPATAQRVSVPHIPIIRTESQDFFRQGRVQFEQEIDFLTLITYFERENLLKIDQFPPLEDGPFSFEQSNTNTIGSEDEGPHSGDEDLRPHY